MYSLFPLKRTLFISFIYIYIKRKKKGEKNVLENISRMNTIKCIETVSMCVIVGLNKYATIKNITDLKF